MSEAAGTVESSGTIKPKLKTQRTAIKRKITLHIKALSQLIEQNGSKTRIRQFIQQLEECIVDVEKINIQYIETIPEVEREKAYDWYEEEFERVNEVLSEAAEHLDLRESAGSCITGSVASETRLINEQNVNSAKAKAKAAQIFAEKQKEMEKEKRKEIEKSIELRKELLKAHQTAEIVELELEMQRVMSEEADKTRELVAEAACLRAEAAELAKIKPGVDELQERLKEFDEFDPEITDIILPPPQAFNTAVIDSSLSKVPGDFGRSFVLSPPEAFNISDKSVVIEPEPKQFKELKPRFLPTAEHSGDSCKYVVDSLENLNPTFNLPSSTPMKVEPTPPRPCIKSELKPHESWISQLVAKPEKDTIHCNPSNGNKSVMIRSSSDSLPKLKLDIFDGDPLKWPDWMSMFQSIIHDANISSNAKMHHLQNSVTGRAKEAIEGYGYTGDSYVVALGKLESRFGKPDVVVKAHLNRLRRWSKLSEDRLQELRHFSDAVSSATNTFKRLGYVEDLHAANNLNMVVDKLPLSLVVKWKEHRRDQGLSKASLVDFSYWIESQAEVHEELNLRSRQFESNTRVLRHGSRATVATVCSTSTRPTNNSFRQSSSCIMGDMGPHKLSGCPKFKGLSVQDRLNKVKENNLCFRCFGKHWAKDCTSSKQCGVDNCTKLHNELLHRKLALNGSVSGSADKSSPSSENRPKEFSSSTQVGGSTKVLLQIIPVVVFGPGGRRKTYALLDLGSTCSLILDELARSLRVTGKATSLDLYGIQTTSRLDTRRVSFSVGPDDGSGSKFVVNNALAVKQLNLPPASARLTEIRDLWKHLADLDLQDLDGAQVEVVLGSDVTEIIIPREVREGPKGSPLGVRTKLGWTVTGSVPGYTRHSESVNFTHVSSPDEELNELVKSWWKTESFGCAYDSAEQRSREDEKVMKQLEETTRKIDNRYEVGLIWKDQNTVLPNNRLAAEKRLHSLEKRLGDDPNLSAMYKKTIETDLEKGYIRKLSEEEKLKTTDRDWYLPHHPVSHPNKPGKVRRVCDAAASYKGTSLNNQLSAVSYLLNSLVGILMRFRQEPIAISADIESMFNQVAVPLEDQATLRFLWRNSPEDEVEVYQYVRHIFGAKSAPTCANYALRRTAQDNEQLFPKEAEVVMRNFYMDDLFKSVATCAEASALQTVLVELLSLGGFRLTKWISNKKELLKTIPEEERAQSVRAVTDDSNLPVEKALGVNWNVQEDTFQFKIVPKELGNTRRKIVSIVASLFDPLGLLAPYVLKAKMFLQRLWQLRQGWDDDIPNEYQKEWSQWQKELEKLQGFSVPRFYRTVNSQLKSVQLHVFGDASELAFCAVAYFRFEYSDGRRQCIFVAAKTRVAPLKPLSIPKLELQAAVLCARLAVTVKKEHDYEAHSTWLWTDSSSVLGQIRGQTKRHPAFVANRLSEILDHSEPRQWRHCPGKLNPADDGSRGLDASAITTNCRWLNGPAFLLLSEHQWPEDIPTTVEVSFVTAPSQAVKHTAPIFDLSKYSSLTKVCRVTAWIKRFVKNCRSSERLVGPLKVDELRKAKQYWIKHAQMDAFREEIKTLKSAKFLTTKGPLITLTPFLDDSQVLRVGGRIGHAEVADDIKHPIIIPQSHYLCNLLVMDVHHRLKHEGIEHVRNELRQVYWIPHSRSTVRRVLNDCPYCKRRRIKPQAPLMASLPKDRLTVAPPFSKVGVDYFGPLTVKHLRKQEKRYGCLFTCLVTRAVHLEVATSLETDTFINALRRFIARRGTPTDMYSDNGTNFVGADRELRENLALLDQSKISDCLAQREIQWHFNPPASPHCGGVWERLVQSCKKVLKVVLQGQVVTDDVLHTTMTEAEALVNSRPLTEVNSDIESLEALTPNHFLLTRANPVLPIGVFADKEVGSRKRWRQVQALADRVWNRWLKEYLPTLTERKKCYMPTREIKVGDLVLLAGEKTSRAEWPLARVVNVFPGKDKTTRVCEVKTRTGVLKRSTAKIALLEES